MEKEGVKNVLHPYGSLDILYYYSEVSRILNNFLKYREIATKTVINNFFFLKRGSNSKPMFIEDLKQVDEKMLKLRAEHHLDEVKNKLNDKQILIWQYFVPRKFMNFFYATNKEGIGKPINRIFIDIDRRKQTAEDARKVALALVNEIKKDKEFNKKLKYRVIVLWTGNSFHVLLLLKNKINLEFYSKYLSYGKKKQDSFIMKWAKSITEKTNIEVSAGHEKSDRFIILDSSNTPSGKLARAPFSLHVKNSEEYDGICVPVSLNELGNKNLIIKLRSLTPEKVLKDIDSYKRLL
jgi:hypothetical protein